MGPGGGSPKSTCTFRALAAAALAAAALAEEMLKVPVMLAVRSPDLCKTAARKPPSGQHHDMD